MSSFSGSFSGSFFDVVASGGAPPEGAADPGDRADLLRAAIDLLPPAAAAELDAAWGDDRTAATWVELVGPPGGSDTPVGPYDSSPLWADLDRQFGHDPASEDYGTGALAAPAHPPAPDVAPAELAPSWVDDVPAGPELDWWPDDAAAASDGVTGWPEPDGGAGEVDGDTDFGDGVG